MIRAIVQNAGPVGTFLLKLPRQTRFATAQALNASARDVQTFALQRALPGAFTLRSRGTPWQKPGSKFGFNVRPWASRDNLTATIGSQADWLTLQERGGTKTGRGHRVAIEAGARPGKTAVLPAAVKPRRLLSRKKKGGFLVDTGGGTSLLLIRTGPGPGGLKLQYVLKAQTKIKASLNYEARGGAIANAVFPNHFTAAFARAVAITTNDALVR